jgi:hypothetical protein
MAGISAKEANALLAGGRASGHSTDSRTKPRTPCRFPALARLPRVRVAFSSFARRTASASSSRDWGGVFSSRSRHRIEALCDLIVVASLTAHVGIGSMDDAYDDDDDRYRPDTEAAEKLYAAIGKVAAEWAEFACNHGDPEHRVL